MRYENNEHLEDLLSAIFQREYALLTEQQKAALLIDYTNAVRNGDVEDEEEYVMCIRERIDEENQGLSSIAAMVRRYQELYL